MSAMESLDEKWVKPMLTSIADQPVLWNEQHPDFKNQKTRSQAWSVVVAHVKKQSGIVKSRQALSKRFKGLKDSYQKIRQNKGGVVKHRLTKNTKYCRYLTFLGLDEVIGQVNQPKVITSLLTDPAENALSEFMRSMPTEKAEQQQRYEALKEQYNNLSATGTGFEHGWRQLDSEQEHIADQGERRNASCQKSRVNSKLRQTGLRTEKILWEMALLRQMIDSSDDDDDDDDDEEMEIQASDPQGPDVQSVQEDMETLQNIDLAQLDLAHNEWPGGHENDDERKQALEQLFASKESLSQEMAALRHRFLILIKDWKELKLAETTAERAIGVGAADRKSKRKLKRQKSTIRNKIKNIKLKIHIAVKDIQIQQLRESGTVNITAQNQETEIRRFNANAFQNDDPRGDDRIEHNNVNNGEGQEFPAAGANPLQQQEQGIQLEQDDPIAWQSSYDSPLQGWLGGGMVGGFD